MEFATHNSAIKDALDFELFMVIDDLRRSRATTGEWIGRCRSELYDGEDRMATVHGEGELELVGSMADARSDFEGPEASMGEFRRRGGSANVACVKPDFVTGL